MLISVVWFGDLAVIPTVLPLAAAGLTAWLVNRSHRSQTRTVWWVRQRRELYERLAGSARVIDAAGSQLVRTSLYSYLSDEHNVARSRSFEALDVYVATVGEVDLLGAAAVRDAGQTVWEWARSVIAFELLDAGAPAIVNASDEERAAIRDRMIDDGRERVAALIAIARRDLDVPD